MYTWMRSISNPLLANSVKSTYRIMQKRTNDDGLFLSKRWSFLSCMLVWKIERWILRFELACRLKCNMYRVK
jgi:hypothetical protein